MVSGTLYTFADSFRGYKCRIAAAYGGASLKVVELAANDKTQKFVPFFETDDKKFSLMDPNAIAFYLASDALRGSSLEHRSLILECMFWGQNEVSSAVASWVYPALSLVEATTAQGFKAQADLRQCFVFLEEHLLTRTFLETDRLTMGDISIACDLALAYQHVLDAKWNTKYPNVTRWFKTIINQAEFKKVVGEFKFCEKPATFDAATFEANKEAKKASEKKPKEDKPKAEPKAKKAAKPAEEADEEDAPFDEGPKNDPFAAMPKGTMNMDEFKRTYSNEDTGKVALPYFWKNFDKEAYSMWFCEYKYADELTQCFMTSNLVGGMFQRIERLRKNAFGSMNVYGENNNNTIAGVWFWKGQELVFPLSPDWTTDYESYEWRKLSPDNEADRKLLEQSWSWEGEFKGLKFNCGKIFK